MVTAQNLVDSSTKADLVDQAEDLGLDTAGLNKTELAEAILAEEGEEPEAVEDASDDEEQDSNEDVQPEVADAVQEVREAEVDSDKDAGDVEAGGSDEVLVRFVGKNPTLQTAGMTFKRDNPFKVLSREDADLVFEGKYAEKFRTATPKEIENFYS